MRQQPSLFPHTPSSILLAYSEHSISDMGICHKFSISQHNYPIMVFTDVEIGLVEIYFKDLPACCSISGNMEGKTVHSTFNLSCCMSLPMLTNTQAFLKALMLKLVIVKSDP